MAIPTANLSLSLDLSNGNCFLNGKTALNDLSGNGKNFTLSTSSYTFDTSLSALTVPSGQQAAGNPADFAYGTSALTVLYWAKLNPIAGGTDTYDLWLGPTGGSPSTNYVIYRFGSTIRVLTYGSPSTSYKDFSMPTDSKWHLITVTRPINATMNDVKLYIDGVEISSSGGDVLTQTFNTSGTGRANISSTIGASGLTFTSFDIYTAQFTSAQVLEYYNSTLLKFQTPTRTYDISNPACFTPGNIRMFNTAQAAYNPRLINSPTYAGTGQSKYFQLNGSNQYLGIVEVDGPQISIGGPYNALTMICWFQANSSNQGTIASFGRRTTSAPSIVTNDLNFSLSPGYSTGSFNPSVGDVETSTTVNTNDWQMVAFTADGTNTKIYLNGTLQETASQSGGYWPDYGSSLFGANVGGYGVVQAPYFNGKIGYFMQYKDIALPAEAIQDFYDLTVDRFSVPNANLITEIDFGNPACFTNGGTVVNDLSGNENNWQLSSSSYTYNAAKGTLTLPTTTNLISNNTIISSNMPFANGDLPFSMSFWFYYNSTNNPTSLYSNGASEGLVKFETLNTGALRIYVGATTTDTATNVFTNLKYNNIQMTYDLTTWNVYVDNNLVASGSGPINQNGLYPALYFNKSANTGVSGLGLINFYDANLDSTSRTNLYNSGNAFLNDVLPPVTGKSNGRRFGQGFPQ